MCFFSSENFIFAGWEGGGDRQKRSQQSNLLCIRLQMTRQPLEDARKGFRGSVTSSRSRRRTIVRVTVKSPELPRPNGRLRVYGVTRILPHTGSVAPEVSGGCARRKVHLAWPHNGNRKHVPSSAAAPAINKNRGEEGSPPLSC